MRRVIALFIFLLPQLLAADELTALVYHDIVPAKTTDDYAVTADDFREQMAALQRQGYRPVSLQTLEDVQHGRMVLPHKAVLLTFDDGLASFRRYALPILAEYGFPAVLSVETGWLDGRQVPDNYRGRLLTWEELREIQRSPLVELASHTDDLHHGIPSNPQGNLAPASITRRFDVQTARYESEASFRHRIRADLMHSRQRLKAETRAPVRAIVWPYGHVDSVLIEEAQAQGMNWQLTLGLLPARTEDFPRISRILIYKARRLSDFEQLLLKPPGLAPQRFLEVALDDWSRLTEADRERRLSLLLTRLELMRVNTVILSPFTRDGRYAFFANPGMPSAGDFLNRTLHQMRTRAGIRSIILRLPADQPGAGVYTELARRHPYDGILLSHDTKPPAVKETLARFAYYRPGLACGMADQDARAGCADFRLVTVAPDQAGRPPGLTREDRVATYYLLKNSPELNGNALVAPVRELNRSGARHFGLYDSASLDDRGTLIRVTVELAGQPDSRY